MSDVTRPEDSVHIPTPQGTFALELRIADLLDGVTVRDASNARDGERETRPAQHPEQTKQAEQGTLPGEPLVTARERALPDEVGNVPPFLVQSREEKETRPSDEFTPESSQLAGSLPSQTTSALSDIEISEKKEATLALTLSPIVHIRGRSDGVVIEIGVGTWNQVTAALAERLESSGGFFRKSNVALDLGSRPVTEGELKEIAQMLAAQEMSVGVVRTRSERTFQAALAVGLAVALESSNGAPDAAAMPATAHSHERETDAKGYFVYKGYLRSGHRLRRREHIIVIGDINPGAEVISDGDVLVWGRLRGVVHAGAGGDRRALVAALDLEPTQLRIADVLKIAPDPKPGHPGRFFWRRSQHKRPEIARVVQDEIITEEWDVVRPGELISLKRGGD
jgi:septum site-determining protein MinC